MNLKPFTINHLSKFITGDKDGWPYRSGPLLVRFFNSYGFRDTYAKGFPSRHMFAEEKLTALNNKPVLKDVIKDLLDARNWIAPQRALNTVNACANELSDLLKYDGYEIIQDGLYFKVKELTGSLITIDVPFTKASELFEIAIEEQIKKCRDKIASDDFDGAITNARSLVEILLISIEHELDSNAQEPDGDLVRSFTRVRLLLNLDPSRKDISDALKQVLTGLTSIVNGLATMRNKMSDAHATSYKPAKHHAKLAVNSAKTLADFLFETMAYQKSKGTLPPSKNI